MAMRPRGTAVRFDLVDQIDVEEPATVTPRAVKLCCHGEASAVGLSRIHVGEQPVDKGARLNNYFQWRHFDVRPIPGLNELVGSRHS